MWDVTITLNVLPIIVVQTHVAEEIVVRLFGLKTGVANVNLFSQQY